MLAGKKVSVVIPEWNEFSEALSKADQILQGLQMVDQVVIVDDGSDNLPQLPVQNDRISVLRNSVNHGVGFSFIRGINHALDKESDFIICWTLIDRGLCLGDFRVLLEKLVEFEFVSGIRQSYKGEKFLRRAGMFLHRLFFFCKTGRWLKDTTIGIRGVKKSVFEKVALPTNEFLEHNADRKELHWFWRYGFETWILLQAFQKKLKISLCPITAGKAQNSSIRLRGKNSVISVYVPFFKKISFE